jgi:hypothetical protein
MVAYNPDKFASLYETELGQRIWALLTEDENVARLETASQLGKPAVEGIEEHLLDEFREEVLADRVKQMVGHMVRQILEQRDWVLDQTDVKVQSVPFSKAARYRRPDWITFHAFRNCSDPRDVVITDRRQNAQLPPDARWAYYATFASPLKASVAFGVHDIRQLRQQVHAHGYQRMRIERMLRRA